MATFFGEIVFPSSRTFEDDEEDEIDTADSSEVIAFVHPRTFVPIDTSNGGGSGGVSYGFQHLVVVSGQAPEVFATCYFIHQVRDIIASIRIEKEGVNRVVGLLIRPKAHPDVLVCHLLAPEPLENHLHFTLVQQLFNFLGDSNVTVTILASCSGSEYKTERSGVTFPLLRCLTSSSFRGTPACAFLESPNTVSDVGAAVLSHCQIHHIPAVMYVGYTDYIFFDSRAVNVFNPLLTVQPFLRIAKKCLNFEEHMKRAGSQPTRLDSLYT